MSEPTPEVEAVTFPVFDVPAALSVEVAGSTGLIRADFPAGQVTPATDDEYALLAHARDAGLVFLPDDPRPDADTPTPKRGKTKPSDTPPGDAVAAPEK